MLKCDVYSKWNIIQPRERMKFYHLKKREWNCIVLNETHEAQKGKLYSSLLSCRAYKKMIIELENKVEVARGYKGREE